MFRVHVSVGTGAVNGERVGGILAAASDGRVQGATKWVAK